MLTAEESLTDCGSSSRLIHRESALWLAPKFRLGTYWPCWPALQRVRRRLP